MIKCTPMARIDVQINQPMGAALFKGSADLLRLNTDRSIWVRMAESEIELRVENGRYTPDFETLKTSFLQRKDSPKPS